MPKLKPTKATFQAVKVTEGRSNACRRSTSADGKAAPAPPRQSARSSWSGEAHCMRAARPALVFCGAGVLACTDQRNSTEAHPAAHTPGSESQPGTRHLALNKGGSRCARNNAAREVHTPKCSSAPKAVMGRADVPHGGETVERAEAFATRDRAKSALSVALDRPHRRRRQIRPELFAKSCWPA